MSMDVIGHVAISGSPYSINVPGREVIRVKKDLSKLFRPKTVAVIGATDRPGSFGNFPVYHLRDCAGVKVYYVNPRKEELYGQKVYPTLAELPEVPECIVVATPAETVNSLLRQAGDLGIKDAFVFSSGFSEAPGGDVLEKELVKIAEQYQMNIVGPNGVGIINNVDKIKLWGSVAEVDFKTRPTGVAILAQSGGAVVGMVSRAYINLSYAVSSGNGSVVTIEELMEYCVEDENVTAVSMYLEGVKKPEVFYRALKKAAQLRKPVIIYKTGRSKKGAISAASHTGNLAGSNEVFKAVFDKYGVIQVDSFEELVGTTQMYSILGNTRPTKNGFGLMSMSGGETTACADLCEAYGINLPDLEEKSIQELQPLISAFATPKNPLDMTAEILGQTDRIRKIIEAFGKDESIDCVICGFDFYENAERGESYEQYDYDHNYFLGQPLLDYKKTPGLASVLCISQYEDRRSMEWRMKLRDVNIPIMSVGEIGFKIIGKMAKSTEYDHKRYRMEAAVPSDHNRISDAVAMSEFDSKNELAAYGIPVPVQYVAASIEELDDILKKMTYPVALKVNSRDILHKTEAGGVKLNISDAEGAAKAFEEILASCKEYDSKARIDGILVQNMAQKGTEMIIGVNNDPMFGPMLMIGMGGVFVEVFKDVALSPCPVSNVEAHDMLKKLKSYKLLTGYRGSEPCDLEALADLMVKVSEYASKNCDTLKEMDINPVFVYGEGKGVCVVDALIVRTK